MTGLRDWIACPTLWVLRRDRPQPSTVHSHELVRRIAVGELVGQPPVGDPDVRWSPEVPYLHAATAAGRCIARCVREALDHRGFVHAGYHDADLSAIETAGEELCWWLVDVGTRPAAEAWLQASVIAAERPGATHVGVIEVRLRRWPSEPTVTVHDPRPVQPIAYQVGLAEAQSHGYALSDPRRWPRTPGLHCSRCPDNRCPVRVAGGAHG